MKRPVKIILGSIVALAAVAVGSLFVLDPDAMVQDQRSAVVKIASEQLGRELTVGEVTPTLFPDLGGTVKDIKLAGAPDSKDGEPQLVISEAVVAFSLWDALISFGKNIRVTKLSLRGVHARARRDSAGIWDFQDILDRQPPSEPSDTIDLSVLAGASIVHAALEDATVTIDDAQLGRPLTVRGSLRASDVRLGADATVKLDAELVDGDRRTPLTATVTMSDLPAQIDKNRLPDIVAKIALQELAVGPWGALLTAEALRPTAGDVALDLALNLRDGQKLDVDGKARAKGLVLAQGGKEGRAIDLDTQLKVALDGDSGRTDVQSFALAGSGIDIKASLSASSPTAAGVEKADVTAKVADLARVFGAFPPGLLGMPEDVKLEGPFALRLTGNASALDLTADLNGARVAIADAFDKKAGSKLQIALKGARKGDRLVIEPFAIDLSAAKIAGSMSFPTAEGPFEANLSSGAVSLSSLKDVVPPFAQALARGERVDGTVSFELAASAQGAAQKANAKLAVTGLDVQLASAAASGQAGVTLALEPKGADGLDARLTADLSSLTLVSRGEDGAAVLDKPAGVPLDFDVHVLKTGAKAVFQKALVRLGQTKVDATGTIDGLDGDVPTLALDLGALDVAFDDLRKTVPGASSLPAGGRLRGKVKLTGAATAAAVGIDATAINLELGSSRLAGRARITRLDEPELDIDLNDVNVRFDDLRSLSEALEVLPAGGTYAGTLSVKGDTQKPQSVVAKLQAKSLTVATSNLNGSFELEGLEQPRFTFDLKGDFVDVDALLAAFGGDEGAATNEVDENPHGLSDGARKQLRKTSGTGSLRAKRVVFEGLSMSDFVGKLTMTKGKIGFDALDFTLYGGRVSAAGTTLDLPAEYTGYKLKLDVDKMDVAQALTAHTGLGQIFSGALTQAIDVNGAGLAQEDLVRTVSGPVALTTRSLTIAGLDIVGAILGPLSSAAKKTPGAPKIASAKSGGTTLEDLKGTLMLGGGHMKLKSPMKTNTGFGALSLEGGSTLGSTLDFTATADISPATIAKWTGGKVKPSKPIPVPLKIGGTWKKPMITGVDVGKLLQEVLGAAAGALVDDAKDLAKAEADKAAAAALKRADGAKAAATDAAKKQAAAAKAEADKAKKQAAAEAKKKADAAKKQAKAEADKAKKKAKAEAKKRADAAKKKAEKERKKLLGF